MKFAQRWRLSARHTLSRCYKFTKCYKYSFRSSSSIPLPDQITNPAANNTTVLQLPNCILERIMSRVSPWPLKLGWVVLKLSSNQNDKKTKWLSTFDDMNWDGAAAAENLLLLLWIWFRLTRPLLQIKSNRRIIRRAGGMANLNTRSLAE